MRFGAHDDERLSGSDLGDDFLKLSHVTAPRQNFSRHGIDVTTKLSNDDVNSCAFQSLGSLTRLAQTLLPQCRLDRHQMFLRSIQSAKGALPSPPAA